MLAESIVPRILKTIVIPLLGSGWESGADGAAVEAVCVEEASSKFTARILRRVALICKMLSRSGTKSAAALRA